MSKPRITFEVTSEQLAIIEDLEAATGMSRSMLLRVATRLLKRMIKAQADGGKCYVDNGDGQLVELFITF